MDDRLAIALRYAAGRNQIALRFAPVADPETGAVAGFVVRPYWAHPERGLLPPEAFLPLAESIDLADDLGAWTVELACEAVAGWGGEALDALAFVAVVVAPSVADADALAERARVAAEVAGLPPDRLLLTALGGPTPQVEDVPAEEARALLTGARVP